MWKDCTWDGLESDQEMVVLCIQKQKGKLVSINM